MVGGGGLLFAMYMCDWAGTEAGGGGGQVSLADREGGGRSKVMEVQDAAGHLGLEIESKGEERDRERRRVR